jgi:hypothetical protein
MITPDEPLPARRCSACGCSTFLEIGGVRCGGCGKALNCCQCEDAIEVVDRDDPRLVSPAGASPFRC